MALNSLFPDEEPRALSVGKPNIPDFIPEAESSGTPSVPQGKIADFIPEAAGQGKPADFIPEAPLDSMPPDQQDAVSRVDRLLAKGEAARTEVERSYPGEIATSFGRGAVAVAKLPVQVTKIIGADILGSKTVKRATEPILESMEDFAESPLLKPGKEAGGKPIDLDRIISNPGEVIGQITSQATNPRFWASQLPEGAMSMIPAIIGGWAPRAVALSGKLGVALEAAQAAGKTAEVAAIAKKLNRLSTIGMYGVSMAMEAGQAEEKVRAYEEKTGKEVAWAPKVAAILGTGVVAGGLEAFSVGRVLYGKGGGEISVPQMIEKIFAGKDGRLIVHKILDSVATEGITEGAQSFVENAAAKWGFDPDQKLTEGIVESVLIGAALGMAGGAFEGAKVRHEAAKAILEKKRLAEEEYQSTMRADQGASLMAADQGAALEDIYAGMPGVQAVPEAPPVEPEAPEYTVTEPQQAPPITQTEPPGGSPIVDQFGQPIYEAARQDALDAAMRKEPWDRNAHEKWLVDQATKGAAPVLGPNGEVVSGPSAPATPVAPEPMGTSTFEIEAAAPVQPAQPEAVSTSEIPAVPDLRTRVSQLVSTVDENGDPGAANELTQLLISNQKEVGDLFRIPDQEIPGLKPIAERLDKLIRQVDETGDPQAAQDLHRLLSASQNVLSGVSRWEITKAAGKGLGPEPMAPSSVEVTDIASQPTTPPPAPKGKGFDQTFDEFHAEHLPTFLYGHPDATPEDVRAFTAELHKLTVDTALADGRLSPQDAEKLGHFDRYPDLAEQYRPRRGLPGAQVQATTARGTTIDSQYELMDIHDLTTSHDDNLTINPAFPQELQPRERSRVGSQLQVAQIEQNLQPGYLGESPGASEGAPIIGHDNLVESGNARTIALRRLYGRQGAEVYRQWLRDNAHRFGIAPGQIDQVQNPILVRRRMTDMDQPQRKQFVREANEPTVAAMSAVEIARSDAAILKDLDILQHFIANDKGTISSSDNLLFINRFMERVVGPTERNRFQTSKGLLNQDGERRIRNALFALAFDDSAALEKLAESPDDNSRNITGAMTMVAARLASINKEIAKGNLYNLNIANEIGQAADILQSLRDQGISVEDYLAQQKLFTDIDPMVADLLQVFSRFGRSRVKLTAIFNGYADALEALGNPRQMELLGPKIDITKAELLGTALEKVGEQYGKGPGESVSTDVQQDAAGSDSVAPEADGAVGSQEASEEGGEDGASPPVPEEEVDAGFDLTGGKPKTTAFETRLQELKDEYPDIDLDRAATVLRAFPNAENGQIVNMAADPEMFSQVARGNLSAEEKKLLLEKAATQGQQGVLPGLDEGAGGLFDQEPQAPKTPSPPKSNMDVLIGLPTGAWQSFDKAFTDAEMELIPKAIDAKMISVKTVDGKVRYSRTGDLGTWLADNPATGPIKFSMENGRVQVEIMPKSSVGGKPQQNFRVNGQWVIGLKELNDKWPVVYDRVIADYPDIAPKTEKPQKPADLGTAFTDLINTAFEHPNPPGPITPKDVANIAKKALGISQEDLPQRRKEIEEAFEFAMVRKAREIVDANRGKDPLITFSFLKKLYSVQPALTSRTSSSVANQAYSTPAPLAYLMSRWTGITLESWVYEPTAGNGMLLVEANQEMAWANELDPARAENLKEQGFDVVTQEDGKNLVGTANGPQKDSVDVVVANPPFGNLDKPVDFDGYKISKLEHLIALNALEAMDDDGRAAIILGGHSFFTPWGAPMAKLTDADRIFFNYLYSRYNVTHHINVDGKVYERMGTKFPIRLITIEGRKATPDKAAAPVRVAQIELAKTLDSIYTLIKGDIDNATGPVAPQVSEEQPTSPSGTGGDGNTGRGGKTGQPPDSTPGGNLPGTLEGQGPGTAGTNPGVVSGGTEVPPPRGPRNPAGPGAPGSGGVQPQPGQQPGRPPGSHPVPPGSGGATGTPGVSPRPKPGAQKEPSGPLFPGPAPGTRGGGEQSGRVPPKSIGSGTKVTLPNGTIVTIKSFSAPKPQGGITLQDVQKEFGRVNVKRAGDDFALTLPNGKVITVLTNQEFQEAPFEELKKDYPRLTREQYERGATLGEWRVMSVGGVIALGKGSGRITLRHEVFHAACDLVLTGKELEAILAKYGNWEAAAKAYETWKPQQPHGLFAKIYHFFRRLAALLKPNTTENIFQRINSGKVWMRTGTGPSTLPGKALSQFGQTGEQMIEVEDADGNVRRIPISQIQGVIDESGKEVQLSDQDRQEFRVFQKGQQVETNSGVTGQVTKIRGWGDKMVLTVQGPEGAVTVKPVDVKNIVTEKTEQNIEQSPGEGPPPEGTKPETKPPANAPQETKLQVPYVPTSKGRSMNTVAPRYMAEAVSNYLKNLQDEIGDLDEFVRDRLDYKTKDDLYQVMGAEQIEGVALAIDAIERGTGGFVIGHQTGVGKGRMVAAIMRYAKNQGLIPIFLTENDGLFSSMYRDMQDIKSKMNPLILASNKDRARITDIKGNVIRELDLNAIQEAVRSGTLPPRFDAIFTTYYQINSRTTTGKMALLSNLAPRSIVILDESHKGAGDKSQTGAFLRSDITPAARGVIYSSATYAKRADTMALYHRTELGNLNVNLDTIVDNLVRGGVPLQEWVAHQWALSGQMIRNELSFAGIDIPVEVDTENATRDRQRSDDLTQNLRGILSFSRAFSRWVAELNDDFQEAGEEAQPGFRGGISSTGFASVMHNKIAQMLFALRTDATIKEALAALKQGKKVVIGCYNTMEAFLNVMLDSGAVKVGDEVNMNFAQVLRKAADSVRKYTVKQHNGEKETRFVRVEEMPENLQAMWHDMIAMIDNTVTDVPAMPIDTIAKALAKEGYKVGEITGRTHVLDWTEEKNILRRRSDRERYDKATPVNNFNSGALDALIINSSGSTGISLHASETFADQRPRHMILTQMSNEINEAVQLLGRIHRTGQVNKPSYMIKISSLPGEKRPLAILQKKLATLFANVSGKGESAYSLNVNDIINHYGDRVIAEMFADDPDLNERLSGVLDSRLHIDDNFIQADRDGRIQQILRAFPEEGALTKKVTGWTSLQPVATQEEVWNAIDAKYEELVEYLKQTGEYNLESEHLDLQARPVARTVLAVGDESGKSELSSPTYFESVDAKIQRKPMTAKEITNRIEAHLKGKDAKTLANELKEQVEADFGPWLEDKLERMRGAGNAPENIERFEQGARNALDFTLRHLDDYRVGTAVNYPLLNMTGVIYDIKYRPAHGSNPATPGNLKITMAVDSSMRTFKTSMAGIGNTVRYTMSVQEGWLDGTSTDPGWDERNAALNTRPYERRYIVTGNLLGNPLDRGQMAYFTREGGELTSGFVMPLNFDPSGYPELQTVSLNQDQAIRILRSEGSITGGNVNIRTNPGPFTIVVPAARKTGGKYFLDEKIRSHVEHGDFHKIGNTMQAQIDGVENLRAIVDLLYKDHSVVMQAPRATFERVIGVTQDSQVAGPRRQFSFDAQDQADIDAFREKHIAAQPEEKKGLKDRVTEKLRTIYDQTIDRWGSWERAAERAARGGAVVPAGENIVNTLSYMRGVEGRVHQGTVGEFVYQDKKGFDENLGMGVFTGDELVRKGASLKVRLEELKKLADKRGSTYNEATKDLETFMVAQRDLELAGETGNREAGEIKGTHPEESNRVIEAIQRKYGQDFKDLMAVADSVREWGDEMILQPLLQAGFIDEERYAKIKDRNQYYIPYKRLLDDVESYIAANAAAIGVPGRVIKEIKGSERKVLDPLQMWIDLAHKAAYAYAKNRTIRSVYVTAKAAEWQDVKEIPAKYLPVDFVQKQEVDSKLRPQLVGLANALGIKVRMVAKMRGRRLGQFKSWINQEVKDGKLTQEMAKEITVRFATFESTMAHELGHGVDEAFGLAKLLIEDGTPEMKKELNRVADQRAGDAPSKSYKRYIRKKEEQVAEFVSRYIIDRRSVERLAPTALAKFESFLRQNPTLKPLLNFRLSHQAGMLDFGNRVWARSQLPPEPGTLPYFRDGKQRWLKLPPDMFQATQSSMPSEMGILMRIAKFPADTLRAGAIMVPEFALGRNPARDVVQAWLFSRFGFSPSGWVRDAVGLISNDANTQELRRQWEAGGGPLAALAQSFVDPEKITTESIMGDPKKLRYFAHPLDALRYASAFLENLTRFSIYKQAREKGLTHAEAVHEARRTTLDFARSGGHPTVRYLNMIIPFWNASVQGMDKLVTELTGPNKKAVYRRLGMLAGVSILIWLYAHQDDRYKELEDWEKNYFWHLPLGPNVPMLRIPKPFEAGVLFGSTFERLMEWARGENKGGVQSALKAAWEAATPEVIPTIARPYIENHANYAFFRGRPIEDAALQRLPVQLRAKPWTTATAKAISKYAPIAISPVQVEHFIRTWGGGLGANYYLPGVDVILRKAGVLEDIPQPARDTIQNVWGARSFFTQNPTGYRAKSVNDFFERYHEVVQADAGWKSLWNAGQKEDLDKFLGAHPEAMFARVANKYIGEMGKINKERASIQLNKTMDPDQKKSKLDVLDEKIVTLARAGNAFMSQKVAESLKMPSRFTTEGGIRKSLDMDDYYKLVAETTTDAFDAVKKDSRFFAMSEGARDSRLTSTLRQMRDEYLPIKKRGNDLDEVMKPYRFKSLADTPTRRQRAEGSNIFGGRRLYPFLLTGLSD